MVSGKNLLNAFLQDYKSSEIGQRHTRCHRLTVIGLTRSPLLGITALADATESLLNGADRIGT